MLAAFTKMAQDYDSYTTTLSKNSDPSTTLPIIWLIAVLVISIVSIIGLWKVFQKAGKPGWVAIIPIYNMIVWLQIVGRPVWWILLFLTSFIPIVGFFIAVALTIVVSHDLSKSFGKDVGFTVLLVLLPFIALPMLGFGPDKYKGPAALSGGTTAGGTGTPPKTPKATV